MFELLAFVLLQFASVTGQPTSTVGGSGWGNDATGSTSTTTVGGSGWGNDATGTPPTGTTTVGGSGWGNDATAPTTTGGN